MAQSRSVTEPELAWAFKFQVRGVTMVEHAIAARDLAAMEAAFTAAAGARQSRIAVELINWLIDHPVLCGIVRCLTEPDMRLVRVVAFDKSAKSNWFVPWHQDRTICVQAKQEVAGFSNWTIKDGWHHVEPPAEVLDSMLALRVHIDDCDADAGPLEVLPGSHRRGPLAKPAINALATKETATLCLANRGDVLAMRPLLAHRSQRAKVPSRRRVLHLEYAALTLPPGMQWALGHSVPEHH